MSCVELPCGSTSKDRPDMTGSTPLILAAKNGSLEVSVFSGFPTKESHSHFMYLT